MPLKLQQSFQQARRSQDLAVIEGVQALKHAARFDAEFIKIITCDINNLIILLDKLAPDIKKQVLLLTEVVDEDLFKKLSPQPPRTKVIALAKRKIYMPEKITTDQPIVLLENPRDLENIGAVIRVAAAAEAAAVICVGKIDIWHPAVIRGAAGLQYAVAVFSFESFQKTVPYIKDRNLIALDPTGNEIKKTIVSKNPVLIFGTERHGISKELLKISDATLRLPMQNKVSSLNLATSVAATLYTLKVI